MSAKNPRKKPAKRVRLADYRPPAFFITKSDLVFDLAAAESKIRARHRVRRAGNIKSGAAAKLELDAEEMRIEKVQINGAPVEWKFCR